MTLSEAIPLLISAAASVVGGGVLGAWLTNRRLGPKSNAEARNITAAAIDKDWARFEREIGRLVKRLEQAEANAEAAIQRAHECEEREATLKARVLEMEAVFAGMGKARQDAAAIVAVERLADADQRKRAI